MIGELPGSNELTEARKPKGPAITNKLGLNVTSVDEDIAEALSLGDEGVVVTKVGEGPGALAGVREGDVITMIDSATIKSPEDFDKAVEGIESGSSIAVLVQRAQGPIFLAMTVQ